MSLDSTDLRGRITALIQSQSHQGAILEGLEALTNEPGFGDCADLWAPALYQRNALFFQSFLLRHLDKPQAAVIRDLLARAEADGYDALFAGLYPKVSSEDEWNAEILALIAALPDEQLAAAIARRAVPQAYYTLKEDVAATLYQRSPALFRQFVRDHIRPGEVWQEKRRRTYQALRAAAQSQGDDEFYWWIFRAFADGAAWQEAVRQLLQQAIPTAGVAARLQQIQPTNATNVDTAPLVEVVEQFGPATFAYIDANVSWVGSKTALRLLPAVERGGDIALYRKIFFTFGEQDVWQREIRNLLAATPSDESLARGLERWTPPDRRRTQRYWWLKNATALDLYRRNPDRFRPFLLRTVHDPDAALFLQAEQQGDEEFLDFLTMAYLDQLATAITYKAAGQKAITQQHVNKKTRALLESIGPQVIARFERLAARSPLLYVEHAARIVSNGIGVVFFLGDDVAHNPIAYLKERHHAAWRQSPAALREVLETPNTNATLLGMQILAEGAGDANAAARVVENLLSLQAVLLGKASGDVKKLALRCLQNAAAQGSPYAERVLPALAEAMHYHSKDAIAERVMVGFVRARRAATERQSA